MSKKQIADSPFGTFCDQVHVPFKIRIPAGQSTFSLNVPKIFRDRQFYFSSFFLTPNFYSLEATVEDLEDPEVMNTPIEYGIMFKLTFKDKNSLYLGTFELDKSIIKTAVVAQKINEFFEESFDLTSLVSPTGLLKFLIIFIVYVYSNKKNYLKYLYKK